jgi:RNA polymerase sigma factor (sigma-70 family)
MRASVVASACSWGVGGGRSDPGEGRHVVEEVSTPEERFTALFAAHSRAILGFALRRVVQPADAAEVVSDTFLAAWRRLDDVPSGDDARYWLYAVARNNLANQRRGWRRRDQLATRLRSELREVVVADPAVLSGDAEVVRQALDRLRPDDREVLRLAVWEGLSGDRLALVLGVSAVTARTRLHRARQRLRILLAPHGLAEGANSGPGPDRKEMTGTRSLRTSGGCDD